MNSESSLLQLGAACFGIVIGFITYRTLIRTTDKTAISDLAAVVGAVGGGVVTGLFEPASRAFAWYSIGLLGGMALFFVLYGLLNGFRQLGSVMSGGTQIIGAEDKSGVSGPNRPQA
jgi:hypothetical protein